MRGTVDPALANLEPQKLKIYELVADDGTQVTKAMEYELFDLTRLRDDDDDDDDDEEDSMDEKKPEQDAGEDAKNEQAKSDSIMIHEKETEIEQKKQEEDNEETPTLTGEHQATSELEGGQQQ